MGSGAAIFATTLLDVIPCCKSLPCRDGAVTMRLGSGGRASIDCFGSEVVDSWMRITSISRGGLGDDQGFKMADRVPLALATKGARAGLDERTDPGRAFPWRAPVAGISPNSPTHRSSFGGVGLSATGLGFLANMSAIGVMEFR